MDYILAAILGFIEGLTEFIPVSSTAHLLIGESLLGFSDEAGTFAVMIQLGAILAMLALYFNKLWHAVVTLPTKAESRQFAISVIVAIAPALALGALLSSKIEAAFGRLDLICYCLIGGGILLWAVDKYAPKPVHNDAMTLDLKTSIGIGLFQCLALVPGMSRSGSTMIGALLLKVDKRAGAEFSFFLAIPVMIAAFSFDLIKHHEMLLNSGSFDLIAVGFAVAFLTALLVIKPMLNFISKQGYGLFAIWRIVVGAIGLIWLRQNGL